MLEIAWIFTKMDISARIQILASIQTGSVYYFEDEELTSAEPHYFIVLNKSPRSEDFLILVCASSQVEKRRKIIKKLGFPENTLAFVSHSDYPLFKKETVIDCNRAFEKTADALIGKLENNKLKVCTEMMPKQIVQSLIEGVIASSQVKEKIKQVLRP